MYISKIGSFIVFKFKKIIIASGTLYIRTSFMLHFHSITENMNVTCSEIDLSVVKIGLLITIPRFKVVLWQYDRFYFCFLFRF